MELFKKYNFDQELSEIETLISFKQRVLGQLLESCLPSGLPLHWFLLEVPGGELHQRDPADPALLSPLAHR